MGLFIYHGHCIIGFFQVYIFINNNLELSALILKRNQFYSSTQKCKTKKVHFIIIFFYISISPEDHYYSIMSLRSLNIWINACLCANQIFWWHVLLAWVVQRLRQSDNISMFRKKKKPLIHLRRFILNQNQIIFIFLSNQSCQTSEHCHQSVCAHAFRRDAAGSPEETARCRQDIPSSETPRAVQNCFAQIVAGRSPRTGDTAYEPQVWARKKERQI